MSAFLRGLDRVERALIALLSGGALLLACLAMLGRYVIPGLSLDWTFEVIIFATIWATFLAGARSAGMGEHVNVDTLLTLMPAPARRILAVFACLCGVLVGLFLLRSGWIVVDEAFRWDERTTSSLRLPVWIYYLSLPVGAALIVFHLIIRATGLVSGRIQDDIAKHGH